MNKTKLSREDPKQATSVLTGQTVCQSSTVAHGRCHAFLSACFFNELWQEGGLNQFCEGNRLGCLSCPPAVWFSSSFTYISCSSWLRSRRWIVLWTWWVRTVFSVMVLLLLYRKAKATGYVLGAESHNFCSWLRPDSELTDRKLPERQNPGSLVPKNPLGLTSLVFCHLNFGGCTSQ